MLRQLLTSGLQNEKSVKRGWDIPETKDLHTTGPTSGSFHLPIAQLVIKPVVQPVRDTVCEEM